MIVLNKRIKDLILEAEHTRKKTPEIRLQTVFELIEFSENLFIVSNKLGEKGR